MSAKEIESVIAELLVGEVAEPATWLTRDKQIEDDLDAGRLDALLAEADKEYAAGLAR